MFFIFQFFTFLLPLLVLIAFFTSIERQFLAAIQRRQGPNLIGIYGLLHPIADGLKLILKEFILLKSSNLIIFFFSPVIRFILTIITWLVIPLNINLILQNVNISVIYIFTISSLSVSTIILAGWASNSKYAFFGALRSAAQIISYELIFGISLLSLFFISNQINLYEIILSQTLVFFIQPLFPIFLIFIICILAETNRHPFDLPEAESELVSGYNIEYSAMGFALFFLAEYGNIILMSFLILFLFLGGWIYYSYFLFNFLFFILFFILIRATIPRYRYDQLMRLGWKVFLPISFGFFLFLINLLYTYCGGLDWRLLEGSGYLFNWYSEWYLVWHQFISNIYYHSKFFMLLRAFYRIMLYRYWLVVLNNCWYDV